MEINVQNLPDAAEAAVHLSANMPDVALVAVSIGGACILLFTLFVLPVWLFLHYRARARKLPLPPMPAQSAISNADLDELAGLAERIENRLDAVESLMDADQPGWRRQ